MSDIPKSSDELAERIMLKNRHPIEYVEDISLDNHFGLSITGYVTVDDEQCTVLGSIVVDEGEPKVHKCTKFSLYKDIINEDEVLILSGEEAIQAARKIYEKHKGSKLHFKTEEEADVRDIAKRPRDKW